MNLAQKLGYTENAKLLIIHADDAGLSHSENRATIQSLEQGIVNSYSIMVPCPWFYEMANYAKSNPQYDSGIHLTLTCEWENYRFGPVLSAKEVPSLVDENGHFYKKRKQLRENASVEDVRKELEAQIEKAIKFGMNPTHLDSHMYSVGASAEFFKVYRDLSVKYKLPILISKQLLEMVGLESDSIIHSDDVIIDEAHFGTYELFESGKLREHYAQVFEKLESGLNIVLIHPAFDDNEMKGITVNHPNFGSEWRQIEFECFNSAKDIAKISANNIELIAWGDIKKLQFGQIT